MDDARYSMGVSIVNFRIRSVICVPMVAEGEVLGVIHVAGAASSKAFEQDDMALLLGIASQAALSLANSRLHRRLLKQELLEQDLILANRIQHKFLPQQPPQVPGYDFQDDYCAALEVGGDYYDFLELPNGLTGIALGDVSGKGVSAALYMAKLSSDVRFHSASNPEPRDTLSRLNASIQGEVEEGMFVTLVYMVLNPTTGEVRYSNAGHLRPLLRRANGEVITLEGAADFPLGIEEEMEFKQDSFFLQPGDTVVLFTDGLVEATNPGKEQFGDERVSQAIKTSTGEPANVKETLLSAVKAFLRGAPPSDDLTLVCFGPAAPGAVSQAAS
jgi:serine phosphatase RsbU (regulator of sigma subunit)